jgi:hypothetical protein
VLTMRGIGAILSCVKNLQEKFGCIADVAQLVRALPSQQISIIFNHLDCLLSILLSISDQDLV